MVGFHGMFTCRISIRCTYYACSLFQMFITISPLHELMLYISSYVFPCASRLRALDRTSALPQAAHLESQVLRVPHRASQRDVGGDAFQWQNYGTELLLGVALCHIIWATSIYQQHLVLNDSTKDIFQGGSHSLSWVMTYLQYIHIYIYTCVYIYIYLYNVCVHGHCKHHMHVFLSCESPPFSHDSGKIIEAPRSPCIATAMDGFAGKKSRNPLQRYLNFLPKRSQKAPCTQGLSGGRSFMWHRKGESLKAICAT